MHTMAHAMLTHFADHALLMLVEFWAQMRRVESSPQRASGFGGSGEVDLPFGWPDFARVLVEVPTCTPDTAGEPAVLEDWRPAPFRMHLSRRCNCCLRADLEDNQVRLVSLDCDGLPYEVCTVCFMAAELRELATGGLSPEIQAYAEQQLEELYEVLRLDLEHQISLRRNGCSSSSQR